MLAVVQSMIPYQCCWRSMMPHRYQNEIRMASSPFIFSGRATKSVIGKASNTRRVSFGFSVQTPRWSISNLAMEQPVIWMQLAIKEEKVVSCWWSSVDLVANLTWIRMNVMNNFCRWLKRLIVLQIARKNINQDEVVKEKVKQLIPFTSINIINPTCIEYLLSFIPCPMPLAQSNCFIVSRSRFLRRYNTETRVISFLWLSV